MSLREVVHIDGSRGEGGGQMLRIALFLSSITSKPFKITNLRSGRKKPGLKRSHLALVNAFKELTSAEVIGDELGSRELLFKPSNPIQATEYRLTLSTGTASSLTLLLQPFTWLVASYRASLRFRLRLVGGTDVPGGMSMDYYRYVVGSALSEFMSLKLELRSRGFFPEGGGEISVHLESKGISKRLEIPEPHQDQEGSPQVLTDPGSFAVEVRSIASEDLRSRKVAERQVKGALRGLEKSLGKLLDLIEVKTQVEYVKSLSTGTVITLISRHQTSNWISGWDSLGRLGKPAEKVGKEAGEGLGNTLKSFPAIDEHLADNLIPVIALRGGRITTRRLTGHILSAVYVCQAFGFHVKLRGNEISV